MRWTSNQELLGRLSALSLTYPEQGASTSAELPAGYGHVERSLTLGSGQEIYERACTGLLTWQMHRRTGITISATAPTAVTGTNVLLIIGRRPIALVAPCRVVYDVTTDRQSGFAYGTLPGHPESGEESFMVTLDDDGRVTFTVRAFSRPATLLAKAGGPLARLGQDLVTRRYLRTLRTIVHQ